MKHAAALLCFAAGLLGGCAESGPDDGRRLPTLTVQTVDGRQSQWNTDGRNYVLLNIWAPWCAPCIEEMPSLERLDDSVDGLAVVGLAPGENVFLADEFLRRHGIGFPTYYDFEGQIDAVLNIQEYPSSLLLSPDGRILDVVTGPREWDSPAQKDWLQRMTSGHVPG